MPAPPLLTGASIEGHAGQSLLESAWAAPPVVKTTLSGAVLAGVLVGLFLLRGRCSRPRRSRPGRAVKPRAPKRAAADRSDKKKKKGGKRRGETPSAEEAMSLARACEAVGDEALCEEGLAKELRGAESPRRTAPAQQTVEEWATQTQLDEEYEAIIRKHSTLRAARLAKG